MYKFSEPHYANDQIVFTSLQKGKLNHFIFAESRFKEVYIRLKNKHKTIFEVDDLSVQKVETIINQIEPRIRENGACFVLFAN